MKVLEGINSSEIFCIAKVAGEGGRGEGWGGVLAHPEFFWTETVKLAILVF